jgi:hypothetical protein
VIRLLLVGATLATLGFQGPGEHPLKHRILWTWDTWISDYDPGGRSFLQEYKDLVDWMAKNEYTALVLWGFIDGRHGGEAAAKEIARYARSKGIALLPGVSTHIGAAGAYGGFALGLPNHPFNDQNQVRALASVQKPGERGLCYSRPENREWLRRGTEWLLETFEIDGIRLEVPEEAVHCRCGDCLERLKGLGGPNGAAGLSDLAICVPIVNDVFRQKRPAGLVTYAAPSPLWWDETPPATELLRRIPESCVAEWNLGFALHENVPLPVKSNLALLRGGGGSYHLHRLRPPAWAFSQIRSFNPRIEEIRRFSANVRKMKFDGFVVGNAGSPKNPDSELAYQAFIDFTRDPELSLEAFYKKRVPPLYGDQAAEEVARLFSAQPDVHEQGLPFWRHPEGSWGEFSPQKAKRAARAFADQIALTRSASAKASPDGKKRLDAILAILDEYRIICEAAALPLPEGPSDPSSRLAEFYEKSKLPDDLYEYRRWKP